MIRQLLQNYETDLMNALQSPDIIKHNHPPVNSLQPDCLYCRLYGNVAMQDIVVCSTDKIFSFLKKSSAQ